MMEQLEIIRSKRRTIAIEVKKDLRIVVRVPLEMKDNDIQRFVMEKQRWIEKHLQIVKKRNEEKETPFTVEEIHALADAALKDLLQRVAKYAPIVGVTVGRITIRNQRSRWGSCSAKGNLNFNCLSPERAEPFPGVLVAGGMRIAWVQRTISLVKRKWKQDYQEA